MIILNAFRIYTYEAELVTILTHFKQVPALLFLKDENDVTNDSYCLVRKLEPLSASEIGDMFGFCRETTEGRK
jgi:hypothetical protein